MPTKTGCSPESVRLSGEVHTKIGSPVPCYPMQERRTQMSDPLRTPNSIGVAPRSSRFVHRYSQSLISRVTHYPYLIDQPGKKYCNMLSGLKVIEIAEVPRHLWERELETTSSKYHLIAAWAAIIFDPIFAITDYFNIPAAWSDVLLLRLSVSLITLATLYFRRIYFVSSAVIVVVPFTLISLQNAYTYSLIGNDHLLGHNLNYMALLIGAGMFVVWSWQYSVVMLLLSVVATAYFVHHNPTLTLDQFFLKGGLILIASAFFMAMLIRTRYNLSVREIKARIALQLSNESIQAQNAEIRAQAETIAQINGNLENLVAQRTAELERKNKALEEYAFINAHKLRRPLASILGLVNLMNKTTTAEDQDRIRNYLNESAQELEQVIGSITVAIERGEK